MFVFYWMEVFMAETIWNGTAVSYHFIMDHLVIINIFLSLVIIFFQRRSPQTVWTWLLILYFIPILGFVLYLMIGQDFHGFSTVSSMKNCSKALW